MSKQSTYRDPQQIESDIRETRARLDDTLQALELRLSPQNLVDSAFDYVRHGGANEMAANVGRSVKRNPLPVMLTGIGLGWLLLSQRRTTRQVAPHTAGLPALKSEVTTLPAVPADAQAPADSLPPRSVGASATHSSTTGAGTTSSGTDPASVGASATDSPATPAVGSTPAHDEHHGGRLDAARHKARHTTDHVKGRAQSMTHSLRDRASHVRHGSQSAMRGAGHKAQGAGSATTNFIQDHPLMAGAIGVAIGAALGSLFPTTRVENERVGKVRDRAVHKAKETGQQQMHRAQEKVNEQADQFQEKINEKVDQFQDKANQKADQFQDKANKQVDQAQEKANQKAEQFQDKSGQAKSGATGNGSSRGNGNGPNVSGGSTSGDGNHPPSRGG
ncbi:MAG: DUF3618 domain-containing protein [Halomonas sp.]|nr:DUF3618 domain-containing protein [Halomonas sp.]